MYDYLKDILAEAPDDFDGEDVTPAISDFFAGNLTHQQRTCFIVLLLDFYM